ncbi:hypothetical protein H072_9637 [Dactylellina haptotyla CBS 200.50]|uniref:Uncharacterized protein n=1 Tax=Dactylellina haptotyla (strain CBS 200.50) TaxID=1284197 RepID=S8BNE9_DACHA|nr:hypothetical protein H072_9637 [Dactylellina haptotyla CBS 200.50]
MFHVCYALSKSGSKDSPPLTEEAFAKSVAEWKNCLPVVSDSGVREQDLFDEIRTVMWKEISEGLEFMNDLLEKVANEPGGPLLQPIDDWESILDPRFFQDFGDLDPGGGHGCTIELTEDIPSECTSPPPISWEILFSNAIIVMALEVFKDIGEIGATLLCTCGLVFKWLRNTPIAGEAAPKIVQRLDISQRQEVLESANNSLNLEVYPAISKVFELVSHPFLKGVIDDLHQLEKYTISLLKSFELSSADLEHFILVTISHFRHHHLTRLPQVFKHEADEYNSPSYVSRRILEEIKPSVDPPTQDISIASSAQSVNLARTSSHRVSPTVSGLREAQIAT